MNFYEKPLSELTDEEWEQICMRCGKCCLIKYDGDGVIHFSNQICKFFDLKKGKCSCYAERFKKTGYTCKKVNLDLLEKEIELLPPTCAYRCLYEGRELPDYHPLLTGRIDSVVLAKQTVKAMPVFSEDALAKSFMVLWEKAQKNGWSEERFKQEILQVREKYQLRWLETYPGNHQKEKPTV